MPASSAPEYTEPEHRRMIQLSLQVKEVKHDQQPDVSFLQAGVIPNDNGNLLQKAIWITAGVGILGLAIYIFRPHLGWIFSHFTGSIQISQQRFRRVPVHQPHAASQPAVVPTLYSVPVQSNQTAFKAAGYSRVNNPKDSAVLLSEYRYKLPSCALNCSPAGT